MEIIGWLGTLLLTVCTIPQVILCYRQGHADGISWSFLGMWGLGLAMNGIYAIHEEILPLAVGYVINMAIVSYFLYLKAKRID